MRVMLLHNPSSGEEDHTRRELESLIADAGHDVDYQSLAEDDWKEKLDDSGDLIVVAGGDGSVRTLLTAIERPPTVVLVLPLGSANNVARTLGLDLERAEQLLAGLSLRSRRRFDLWDVRSTWGTSRCVEAVGGGLFAEVLAEADDVRIEPSGPEKVDFGLRLLALTLREAVPRRWRVEVGGHEIEEELIGVEAMNIREVGANLCFAPDADPGDALLDVVLVRPEDREPLADYVSARLDDEEAASPPLTVLRGPHVVLEPPGEVRLHVDDLLPAWDLSTTSWVEIAAADVRVDVLVGTGAAGAV